MNRIKIIILVVSIFTFCAKEVIAHPMPNSMVLLKIYEKNISGEIQLPLSELQSAIGMGVNDNSERLIERLGDSLRIYLLKHIRPRTFDGKLWKVLLGKMQVNETKSELSGEYKELIVAFSMTPPQHYDLRNFYFDYDVILHQVASHKALIAIKQDWQQGIMHEDGTPSDGTPPDSTMQQVGVIEWDVVNNKLNPFQISLQQGSVWMGFKSMVSLGTKHISEGTDHLLFLLVLLFPIPLVVNQKKWASTRSVRQSLLHIFKVVTAFTIGHSITLLFGALSWVFLPSKPIEVLIGVSILVSAIHAIKPIFPNRETYIALGFGLIHGLAFAYTLQDLNLSASKMALSILGFNVGIELMQMAVIVAVIPWLLLLSRTSFYTVFRVFGAILAGLAAIGWIIERLSETPNFITILIEKAANYAVWLLGILMIVSVITYFFKNKKSDFLEA
ncbi:HupE/UreJ family protein [Emticicia sp. W12TSBA100-4]|uniref:HupE/UreJ family protein n=1 Tax=Emticicia sp. W12TSBA100-4 TaxID=3160965 RepID=UPI003305D185